jgi:hypothetical protein
MSCEEKPHSLQVDDDPSIFLISISTHFAVRSPEFYLPKNKIPACMQAVTSPQAEEVKWLTSSSIYPQIARAHQAAFGPPFLYLQITCRIMGCLFPPPLT